MMGKGGPGSQSPEMLLPDKNNRSDSGRREKATSMPSGFFIGNSTPEQQLQHDLQYIQHAQSQPPSSQGTLTMFGIVSSPIHRSTSSHSHQHQHHPTTVTTGMIPLSPLLPMPYTAAATAAHGIHNAASVSGIIPLANFTCNPCNTPPAGSRKPTFNPRSPKISPHHALVQTPVPPPLRQTQQQQLQQVPCLTFPCQQQQRGIHHFDRVDGQPRMPWMVPALVVVHSLIFVTIMYDNDCPHNSLTPQRCVIKFLGRLSFQPLNENPLLGPSNKALLAMGALHPDLVTKGGQGWRLLTNIWLHAGLFHLLANMIGLLSIGLCLEKDFGWVKVATIYLIAGFGGSLLSALFLQNQISVGASGALMGLLGSTVAEILVNWSTYHHRKRSLAVLLLAIAVNLSFGLMPHVDNFAHLGGLSAGLLLGFIFLRRPRFAWVNQMVHDIDSEGAQQRSRSSGSRMIKHTRVQTTAWFIALALLLVCYGTAMLALFKGYGLEARKSCKWCQYMSCVPIFLWQCHRMY